MNSRGQFSIIAALFVAVILVATVITTYSVIRDSQVGDQPQLLSAIDETNLAIKQILGFTVGYYGSVLQVTGNSSYARTLASRYLQSGLMNMANMHPEWGTSYNVSDSDMRISWFANRSYSTGNLAVNYSLTGLGIHGITYETSCKLDVQSMNTNISSQARLRITKDENEPVINLGKENFRFYRYENASSTWDLIKPASKPTVYANGTYQISIPSGIDRDSYIIQVLDERGIMVVMSSFSRYAYTLSWNSTLYSTLRDETLVVELLQNGTMRWLGQNLRLTSQAKPIPPIAVKALHINQTINGVNREVPFQIEDWNYNYQVPAGLTSNSTVFSNRQMIVFLANHNTSKVTLWWNGLDTTTQTPYAFTNRYFTKDDIANGILTNGDLSLVFQGDSYRYVDGFNQTNQLWSATGPLPYLNDNTASFISHNVDLGREGWFSFQDLTEAQVLAFAARKSVRVDFDCRRDGSDDYFDFRINDGATTYGSFSITPGGSYGWKSYDVSNIINTTAKVNNAKVEVRYRRAGGEASTVYIRRSRLTIDFGGWLTSVKGTTSAKADFMRINSKAPTYGSNLAYMIHHGIVRDVIHQEAEWSSGITNCPNVYSQIVVTLPANATYYTYKLRLMFVQSQQNRNIADLCPIKLTASSGTPQTENGTLNGYPIVRNGTGLFYNFSASIWAHHWSQIISATKGVGLMFTDNGNKQLYAFDSMAGSKTGALKINATERTIELLPVTRFPVQFTSALDVSWFGAVVTFDGTTPIYKVEAGKETGLWITVEQPPTVSVTAQS